MSRTACLAARGKWGKPPARSGRDGLAAPAPPPAGAQRRALRPCARRFPQAWPGKNVKSCTAGSANNRFTRLTALFYRGLSWRKRFFSDLVKSQNRRLGMRVFPDMLLHPYHIVPRVKLIAALMERADHAIAHLLVKRTLSMVRCASGALGTAMRPPVGEPLHAQNPSIAS